MYLKGDTKSVLIIRGIYIYYHAGLVYVYNIHEVYTGTE